MTSQTVIQLAKRDFDRVDGPLLIMCSAGRDSHCLLDVSVKLLGSDRVHVLHVDHGLRSESGEEARQMERRCNELGASFILGKSQGAPSGNVQQWARELRQSLAVFHANAIGARWVATAHTLTDEAETAIGRLASQPGRRALTGMPRARSLDYGSDVTLFRPFLDVTRNQTTDYCIENGIEWCDDPSNENFKYSRSRIRHQIMPNLEVIDPLAQTNIVRTMRELADEREIIESVVDMHLSETNTISQEALGKLPAALARLIVRRMCENQTGSLAPRAASRLDDVLALCVSSSSREPSLDVGSGARIILKRDGMLHVEGSTGRAKVRVESRHRKVS